MKLIIVDDSILLQERLENMIDEIDGVEIVDKVGNTIDGLSSIKKHKPDFVIVDISMPGGGGIKLLKQVKELYPSVTIAIFTNYPYPEYKEKCLQLGADYFFSKSMEIEKLLTSIKENAVTTS